ncbi:hypothetical protein ACLK1S_21185 [Escherichia coli]
MKCCTAKANSTRSLALMQQTEQMARRARRLALRLMEFNPAK